MIWTATHGYNFFNALLLTVVGLASSAPIVLHSADDPSSWSIEASDFESETSPSGNVDPHSTIPGFHHLVAPRSELNGQSVSRRLSRRSPLQPFSIKPAKPASTPLVPSKTLLPAAAFEPGPEDRSWVYYDDVEQWGRMRVDFLRDATFVRKLHELVKRETSAASEGSSGSHRGIRNVTRRWIDGLAKPLEAGIKRAKGIKRLFDRIDVHWRNPGWRQMSEVAELEAKEWSGAMARGSLNSLLVPVAWARALPNRVQRVARKLNRLRHDVEVSMSGTPLLGAWYQIVDDQPAVRLAERRAHQVAVRVGIEMSSELVALELDRMATKIQGLADHLRARSARLAASLSDDEQKEIK